MHPVLVCLAEIPGIIHLNGRFLGEVRAEDGLTAPIAPNGAIYLSYTPLIDGYLPMARRLELIDGHVVPASLEGQRGCFAVGWPANVLEVELRPEKRANWLPLMRDAQVDGISLRFLQSDRSIIDVQSDNSQAVHELPAGALPPDAVVIGGLLYLTGATQAGERYAIVLSEDMSAALFSITAREIYLMDGGIIQTLLPIDDLMGHARRITWAPDQGSFTAISVETLRLPGAPIRPELKEDAAVAAAEAIFYQFEDEVDQYMAPQMTGDMTAVSELLRASDGITRLHYPLTSGRSAIGLIRRNSPQCATVTPLYYQALSKEGAGGMWQLHHMEAEIRS